MNTPEQAKQEAEAAFKRGKTYIGKQEYDLAIKEFTEAIRLDPTNAEAYLFRGFTYLVKKEYLLADQDLAEAFKRDPDCSQSDISDRDALSQDEIDAILAGIDRSEDLSKIHNKQKGTIKNLNTRIVLTKDEIDFLNEGL